MSTKAYPRIAKRYNLVWLSILTLGSIGYLVLNLSGETGTGLATTEVVRSLVVMVSGILAILGIAQDKLWAKWVAIAIYGFYIFLATEGLVSSISSGSALGTFNLINSSTLIVLRVWRVIVLFASLIGIVLLLRRSRMENN